MPCANCNDPNCAVCVACNSPHSMCLGHEGGVGKPAMQDRCGACKHTAAVHSAAGPCLRARAPGGTVILTLAPKKGYERCGCARFNAAAVAGVSPSAPASDDAFDTEEAIDPEVAPDEDDTLGNGDGDDDTEDQ